MFASIEAWLLATSLLTPTQEIKPAEPAEKAPTPRMIVPDEAMAPKAFFPPPHGPYPPFGMGDPMYYRPSQYDKWQNYGVDLKGYFRPRVIYSPFGAYYRYNGQPYFYAPVHQMYFMPYVTD